MAKEEEQTVGGGGGLEGRNKNESLSIMQKRDANNPATTLTFRSLKNLSEFTDIFFFFINFKEVEDRQSREWSPKESLIIS